MTESKTLPELQLVLEQVLAAGNAGNAIAHRYLHRRFFGNSYKTAEFVRLYTKMSDMGGQLSSYMT